MLRMVVPDLPRPVRRLRTLRPRGAGDRHGRQSIRPAPPAAAAGAHRILNWGAKLDAARKSLLRRIFTHVSAPRRGIRFRRLISGSGASRSSLGHRWLGVRSRLRHRARQLPIPSQMLHCFVRPRSDQRRDSMPRAHHRARTPADTALLPPPGVRRVTKDSRAAPCTRRRPLSSRPVPG